MLKLMWDACTDDEWTPIAGGFTRLKLLRIRSNRFKYWKATDESFPVLEQLLIINCRKLENIPIEFADIYTLHQIVLQGKRKRGLEASAARIRREQEDMGNKVVHVRIVEQHSDAHSDETHDEGFR